LILITGGRKKVGYLGSKNGLESFDFDYWGYFKHCVKSIGISPSEAWKLDFIEIKHLLDEQKEEMDTSFMLNEERICNGAKRSWIYDNRITNS